MNSMIRMAFGEELIKKASKYDFLVFNPDTKSCGLENFGKIYPERNFTFGIAEQNLVAAASGAAACGEKVFLSTFAVFASMRACEQVRTFVCYPKLNVTILASHGGLTTGADGATHIAIEDVGIMRTFPNMTIVEPSDIIAGKLLVDEAIKFSSPLYIRFPKIATPIIHDNNYSLKIGKANLIKNGKDATIIVCGWLLNKVLKAVEVLSLNNIKVSIIEMHTVKPIDKEAIYNAINNTGAIVTVEDHSIIGGLGSAVCEVVCEYKPIPVKRIGILDKFGESGDPELLYKKNHMQTEDIINAVIEVIKRKNDKIC